MKSSKLEEILARKKIEVEQIRPMEAQLREQALMRTEFISFKSALRHGDDRLGVIAEIKKASPSAGIIISEFDASWIAGDYAAAGADAISVLTDERFFQGSLRDLVDVRRSVDLPVLRKEFIIDPVQIYEASVAGADAILLIVAALPQSLLERLLDVAGGCQLDVLVETHTLEEMDRALDAGAEIVGINNRNLSNFEVSLQTSLTLAEEVPGDVILVSESGIKTQEDARRLIEAGVNAILVGETLMRSDDRWSTLQSLARPRREVFTDE